MNQNDFNNLVDSTMESCKKKLVQKREEYVNDPNIDVLSNFKSNAELSIVGTPEGIGWELMTKHLQSIKDYCEGRKVSSAVLDEKIGDAINYLVLIKAIISEREGFIFKPMKDAPNAPVNTPKFTNKDVLEIVDYKCITYFVAPNTLTGTLVKKGDIGNIIGVMAIYPNIVYEFRNEHGGVCYIQERGLDYSKEGKLIKDIESIAPKNELILEQMEEIGKNNIGNFVKCVGKSNSWYVEGNWYRIVKDGEKGYKFGIQDESDGYMVICTSPTREQFLRKFDFQNIRPKND
jgi:hypothetical protein